MRIRWTPLASADLQQISDSLREHHPRYRQRTLLKIYDAVRQLRPSPYRGQGTGYPGTPVSAVALYGRLSRAAGRHRGSPRLAWSPKPAAITLVREARDREPPA